MPEHDLIVIGAGPGGYVAAIRAAQLGLNVACIDKNEQLGGTCLRVGCIPSKALLESSELYEKTQHLTEHGVQVNGTSLDLGTMLGRKDKIVNMLTQGIAGLFKKKNITRYHGTGRIVEPGKVAVEHDGESEELIGENILIATGSSVATLPGVELDGSNIGTSTEALSYSEVPHHLVVIGAGYIGLELGSVWRRLGAKVTVVEYLDRIFPGTDGEIAREAKKLFQKQGIEFQLDSKVTSAKVKKKTCVVECEGKDDLKCDKVLLAVGRKPNTEGLGLSDVGIEIDDRSRIQVSDHFETNVKGIYAIGDVIPGPMLAHKAEEEGVACVEGIVTGVGHVNYDCIPSVAYTHPEVAGVGKTEEQLKEANVDYRKGSFSFRANGRALALGEAQGKVKMLADAKTDRVLGVHIIGPRAGDLIAEAAVAMEFGASSEDIARCCHAHPTLAETIKEAALDVDGRMLNS